MFIESLSKCRRSIFVRSFKIIGTCKGVLSLSDRLLVDWYLLKGSLSEERGVERFLSLVG